jgi:hypothetical protein
MTDNQLNIPDERHYSLEVGFAMRAEPTQVTATIKGKEVYTMALPLDELGEIIWERVDSTWDGGLEDVPAVSGTYAEVSEHARKVNKTQPGIVFFPHPIAMQSVV